VLNGAVFSHRSLISVSALYRREDRLPMKLTRKLGLVAVTVTMVATMAIASAGSALASGGPGGGGGSGGGGTGSGGGGPGSGGGGGGGGGGNGRLRMTGSCGDLLDLRVKTVGGPITVDVTIPAADPSEVWNLDATFQEYGPVTGGRIGNPLNLVPTTLPALAFSTAEGGFTTTGDVPNTTGMTQGISYTATRTSPTPLTCTNTGYWTNPGGTSAGPTAENPAGKPNSAPALTGATEADAGTNDALLQFDQEMLTTAQGIPAANRFAVTVDGVTRTVTGVSVTDDSPPDHAIADLTFTGAALTAGQTVTVLYRQPLTSSDPQLQDLDGLTTPGFGPVSVPAF
jgi:hypothetical protein